MKFLSALLALAAAATSVQASTGVLFPLYFYPYKNWDDGCAAWAPLISAAAAHPSVPFIFVVNPNSGPGGAPGSQPDAAFQQCVPLLAAAGPNVRTVGYIRTDYVKPDRPAAAVQADIDAYAGWDAAYRPSGIFFDEAANDQASVPAYAAYADYARNAGLNYVILNPGTKPQTPDYYTSADLILSIERAFADFDMAQLTLDGANPAAKQAVMLHTAASSPTDLIDTLAQSGVGYVYFTDDTLDNPYDTVPTYWDQEVADLDATN